MDAPWRWLGAGWRDLWASPGRSLGYGLVIVGGGLVIVYALWAAQMASLVPVALGIFALVGPLLALGLYEASRRIAAGETPALFPVRFAGRRSRGQIAYIGFFLLFAALVWVLLAMGLYALTTAGTFVPLDQFITFSLTTTRGIAMLVIGTILGGAVAFAIYLLTVISIPMLMNEDVDAFTAIGTGVAAFKRSPGPMLLWAWLIGILIVGGVATLFFGLAIVFPLLGHATWHAYRDIRAVA